MYKLIELIRASWFDLMKIYNKNYEFLDETESSSGVTQVKLGEIFECEGVLYSIVATSTIKTKDT